ncbi:GL10624 [Drosophila persimilis]|uniref:GL10624 n=1 Tax=Drosophila persimilis TaxID=7234 RepID=B4GAY5_DROPE|nr:GL10624 [Drosophila persimilis]
MMTTPGPELNNQQHHHRCQTDEQTRDTKSQTLWRPRPRQSQPQAHPQSQRHFYNWELSHSLGAPQQEQQPAYLMQPRTSKAAQNDYGRLLF